MSKKQSLKNIFSQTTLFCVISAALMIISFPTMDMWIFAWFGLVPLLFVLEGKNIKHAGMIGFLTGYLFFLGTMHWLMHVTFFGMLLVVAYMAMYWGAFAAVSILISQHYRRQRWVLLPALWVALEFVRAHLFTGFDWGSLGYGQFRNRVIIQIADITGQYGISFLVVMVNVVIVDCFLARFAQNEKANHSKNYPMLFRYVPSDMKFVLKIVVAILIFISIYGLFQMLEKKETASLNIAIIQGNIEQEMKWDQEFWPEIMTKHIALSDSVTHLNPDLIIWPETSFPGQLWDDLSAFEEIQNFVKTRHVPLLLGTITHDDDKYYNSALMLTSDAAVGGVYHKMHLVPFGEFVPMRKLLGGFADFIPIVDFTAGKINTIFPTPVVGELSVSPDEVMVRLKKSSSITNKSLFPVSGDFGVLICFEDAFAENSRDLVKKGAHWLVTITNDAWFKNTNAPFMHLSASVLRAVENRRPVVRAANTGVSAFINRQGRITRYIKNDLGQKTFVAGADVDAIVPREEMTIYTQIGDVFAWGCFLISGFFLLTTGYRRLNKQI